MVRLHANLLDLYSKRGTDMNFLVRFFSIGIRIGDSIFNGLTLCVQTLPHIARQLNLMFWFYLFALPHALLFIGTLGFSKAIKDAIQEHRDKKVLVAMLTERQRIEREAMTQWNNGTHPIQLKLGLKV
jgi:hypothetical protein